MDSTQMQGCRSWFRYAGKQKAAVGVQKLYPPLPPIHVSRLTRLKFQLVCAVCLRLKPIRRQQELRKGARPQLCEPSGQVLRKKSPLVKNPCTTRH